MHSDDARELPARIARRRAAARLRPRANAARGFALASSGPADSYVSIAADRLPRSRSRSARARRSLASAALAAARCCRSRCASARRFAAVRCSRAPADAPARPRACTLEPVGAIAVRSARLRDPAALGFEGAVALGVGRVRARAASALAARPAGPRRAGRPIAGPGGAAPRAPVLLLRQSPLRKAWRPRAVSRRRRSSTVGARSTRHWRSRRTDCRSGDRSRRRDSAAVAHALARDAAVLLRPGARDARDRLGRLGARVAAFQRGEVDVVELEPESSKRTA